MQFLKNFLIGSILLLTSCDVLISDTQVGVETQVAGTLSAAMTATAGVQGALDALVEQMTSTAAIQMAVEETLTAAVPSATDTLEPTLTFTITPIPPTETPPDTPTITPTDTPVPPTPTATIKASATACFVVIDDWCLSHEGCATMDINNATGSNATLRIADKRDGSGKVNSTFTAPPGLCGFMIRPDRYWYEFNYCGEYSEGFHALNDNWWIKFTCP
jgi:hypothetical protein